MKYTIRKTTIEDMHAVEDAHRKSIQEICSKDYDEDQISKWSNVNYNEEIWANTIHNEYHLVVEVDGQVEGLCHAKVDQHGHGHIVGLYFTKVVAGKGIGKEVFEMAMNYLREVGAKNIFIVGTVTAKGFYEKMGFHVAEKTQTTTRGATLECYKMEMKI